MHVHISSMNYFTRPCEIFHWPSTCENSNYVWYLNVMWSGYDHPTLSEEVNNVKYFNESITVSHNNTMQCLTGSCFIKTRTVDISIIERGNLTF